MAEESIKKTHLLKPSRGEWTVEHDDRSVTEVRDFIKGIRVKEIEDAGAAYKDAYRVVADVQWALAQEALALTRVWEGKASVAAQKALRTLYVALGELAKKLFEMGDPLVTLADVVRQHQEYLDGNLRGSLNGDARLAPWSDDDHSRLFGYATFDGAMPRYEDGVMKQGGYSYAAPFDSSRDELAGLHLKTFSEDLKAIYDRMPDKVEKELPAITYPVEPSEKRKSLDLSSFSKPLFAGTSFPSDTGPAHTGPTGLSGDSPAAKDSTLPSFPHHEGPDIPGRPDDRSGPDLGREPDIPLPGADLGAKGSNGNAPSPSDSTRGPNDPTRALDQPTRTFGQPTDPHTKLADFQRSIDSQSTPIHSTPTSPIHSTPTSLNHSPATTFSVPGTSASLGPGTVNGRATASNGMGSPFMPMGGAGGMGGQEEKDRESGTWLHEDDDVWGGDTGGVVDGTLG